MFPGLPQLGAVFRLPIVWETGVGGEGDHGLTHSEEPYAARGVPGQYRREARDVLPDELPHLVLITQVRQTQGPVGAGGDGQVLRRIPQAYHDRFVP